MSHTHARTLVAVFLGLLIAAGCRRTPPAADTGPLRVAATTSILGDVVAAVGGPDIRLQTLLKPSQDPHAFHPAPVDLAALSHCALLFVNGFGLESFLDQLPPGPKVVNASRTIQPRHLAADSPHHHEPGDPDCAGNADPHVWFDPMLVAKWTDTIRDALAARDPAHAADYATRAAAYTVQLNALDVWIREQTAALPPRRRTLVSDHAVLGYFADRYGFTLGGALMPAFSSAAEPSARDLAALVDAIRAAGVPALLVGRTASPALAKRIADETGIRVATFDDGALGAPGSPTDTYLGFMRQNVATLVRALQE